jgi:hypothetical protein
MTSTLANEKLRTTNFQCEREMQFNTKVKTVYQTKLQTLFGVTEVHH